MNTYLRYHTNMYLQHAATLAPTDQTQLLKLLFYRPQNPLQGPTTRCGTPLQPAHRQPHTTPWWHAQVTQAPPAGRPACAQRKPLCPHATIRPQVPPTAIHRMPPLRTPMAATDGPALQPEPMGLPRSRTAPCPLPALRGTQPPPPHAARDPATTPPPASPASGTTWEDSFGFTRIGEEERRDGEAIALHKTHIWANSLKPVCFLCFLLIWCPLLPFIETGTLEIYTKMVLYMKNELLTSNTPHGV